MSEGEGRWRKVPESDPDYREVKRSWGAFADITEAEVFGSSFHLWAQPEDASDAGDERWKRMHDSKLSEARARFNEFLDNDKTVIPALDLINEGLDENGLREELYKYSPELPPEVIGSPEEQQKYEARIPAARVARAIKSGEVPAEPFGRLLLLHVENFRKKNEFFQENLPDYLARSKLALREAVASGTIPIREEEIDSRMKGLSIRLGDALFARLGEYYGTFNAEDDSIVIAQNIPDQMFEHALMHEVLHALSGRTVIARETKFGGDFPYNEYQTQRGGLIFYTPQERFRWLNEAMTETLTLQLLGKKWDEGTYKRERRLLDTLVEKSGGEISFGDFVNAYFENYDPDLPEGPYIPAWERLYSKINEVYGDSFLLALDKNIQEVGIGEALRKFESNELDA